MALRESNEIILARIDERLKIIERSMSDLDGRLEVIEAMAMRYRGGILVILGLGGIIGWLATNIDWARSLFSK